MPDLEKDRENDIIPDDTLTSTTASSSLQIYPSGEFPVSIVLNGPCLHTAEWYLHTLPRTDPGGWWGLPVPFFVLVLSVLFRGELLYLMLVQLKASTNKM